VIKVPRVSRRIIGESRASAAQLRHGEAPGDFIAPKTLNPLARSYLKEAFRAVASVQSGLAAELAMGIRWG
jgi:hypothetical protein